MKAIAINVNDGSSTLPEIKPFCLKPDVSDFVVVDRLGAAEHHSLH